MPQNLNFLDLFAGAGGLSEGFIRAGYTPIAHVEANKSACNTLRTRSVYHWYRKNIGMEAYQRYLSGELSRKDFYNSVDADLLSSVVSEEICDTTLEYIFSKIDERLGGKKLDLIVGGPPCQAYSVVGRSRDKVGMRGDRRNYLFVHYAKFLYRYKPRFFVFENVTGLLSARDDEGRLYLDLMREMFKAAGYATEYMVLSAERYGVPQTRKRVIIVGKFRGTGDFYPEPAEWIPNISVQSVINDLPRINAGGGSARVCEVISSADKYLYEAEIRNDHASITWHESRPNTEQDLEIYYLVVQQWNLKRQRLDYNSLPDRLKTHVNRTSFLDRFKVVASDLPASHTIVAHIAKDGHYYIHPDLSQNRSITPREAARLQTFPDDYYFEGITSQPERTPAFRQIGNAVPVQLASRIATKLLEVW